MASPNAETSDIALVAENSIPLYVPPPLSQDDQFVEDLIARGPLSPRTAQAALENHGPGLSPEVALNLAKKVAQMALDKAHNTELRLRHMERNNQQALATQQVALASTVTIVPLSTLIFSLYLLMTRPLSPPIPPDRQPDP